MNSSLVPANAKKSILLFGFLRPMPDALVLGVGVLITIILLAFFSDVETWMMMLFCIPMLISVLLVMPIPNYHNTLCVIQSVLNFYNGRRNYIWRGWCTYHEYKNNK